MPITAVREFECKLCHTPVTLLSGDEIDPDEPSICDDCLRAIWELEGEVLVQHVAECLGSQGQEHALVTQLNKFMQENKRRWRNAEHAIREREYWRKVFRVPFGDIFGPALGQTSADLHYSLQISFQEAVLGTEKGIDVEKLETCSACHGKGTESGTSRPCHECHRTGRVLKRKTLSIRIPAGVDTGARLRFIGEGEGGLQGSPSGDLYIFLDVKKDDFFERKGNDIYCEVKIPFTQAALGTEIEVPGLESPQKLVIPKGTQTGEFFRLAGVGVPFVRGFERGDQYVKVLIEPPTDNKAIYS